MNAQDALAYLKDMVVEATCLDEDAFDAVATLAACVRALAPFANHLALDDVRMAGKTDHPIIVRLSDLRQARAALKGEL